ncbi:MAG: nuclear transport factor 2 family protein [Bacteroidetes bacterium]|nr:nuclear transport factor 2 family protein [Bacteroidota bacterium]MCA6442676.1 nuclear transport factor 2 family protein [Bacteroidota bacterium]
MKIVSLKIICFILFISFTNRMMAQTALPESIVQKNLDCYNNRDLEGFMSYFADSISLVNFSDQKIVAKGKEEIKALYKGLFESSPTLHSTILKRMVLGNKVIDHESIVGRKGSADTLEIVLIYEVEGGKIIKMTTVRK